MNIFGLNTTDQFMVGVMFQIGGFGFDVDPGVMVTVGAVLISSAWVRVWRGVDWRDAQSE